MEEQKDIKDGGVAVGSTTVTCGLQVSGVLDGDQVIEMCRRFGGGGHSAGGELYGTFYRGETRHGASRFVCGIGRLRSRGWSERGGRAWVTLITRRGSLTHGFRLRLILGKTTTTPVRRGLSLILTNQNQVTKMNKKTLCGALLFTLLGLQATLAQSTVSSKSQSKEQVGEKAIELSPFVVSSDDDDGYQVRQTMVGSRVSKDLIDLPVSVSVINLQQLTDLGATSVHDALRYTTSGVTQNQSFNDDVNIRGFRAGTPLYNGALRGATTQTAPLYDIERVEVLKGPAAMLNGSNGGIGGAINYISRKPTSVKKGEAKLSIGDTGALRFDLNTSGPLYNEDDLQINYRVTLGATNSEAPRGKDIEQQDNKFYGGALALYFGNGSSLTVNGYYYENNDYFYLLDFLDISIPKDPTTNLTKAVLNQYSSPSYGMGRPEDAFWNVESAVLDVTYLTQLTENTNVRAAYYYAWHDDRRENNRGITVQADNYTINRQDIRNNNGTTSHSVQVDVTNNLDFGWMKVDSIAGLDVGVSDSYQDQSVATNMPPVDSRTGLFPDDAAWFAQFPNDDAYFVNRPASVTGPLSRGTTHATSLSYYLQENFSFLNDRLILVGGLRWFEPGGTSKNVLTDVISDRDDTSFRVHKYGLVYKILPTVSVYYTDAQNVFPAPAGRTDLEIQADMLGDPYKDSLGKLKELGVKYDYALSDKVKVYGSLALFKMEQTNIRTFGVLPSGNMGLVQSAKDSAEGWETDIGIQFKQDDGRADIILTYFDGDSAIADDEGKPYVRQTNAFVPQKFSAFAKYSWTAGSLKGFRMGAGVETESDKRYGAYMLEHPLLADAFFGYSPNEKWDFQVNLNNLTDERYIVQTAASALVQGSDTFRAKLTVRYRW